MAIFRCTTICHRSEKEEIMTLGSSRGMYRTMFRHLSHFIQSRKRFMLPVLVIALLHTIIGLVVYYSLRSGMTLGGPFASNYSSKPPNWLQLFSAWDSSYYLTIALNWYPPRLGPSWAFMPLYPATVRSLTYLGVNAELGAFMVASFCGLASIVVFQKIAEQYMVKTQALVATIMYFLFPPVFVFSVVSYPEALYLLLALLSWHFHQKHSDLKASGAAALCALSRPEGFLLAIPFLYDYLTQKQFRKIGYVLVLLSGLGAWELYGLAVTGVWLPSHAAGEFWNTAKAQAVKLAIQQLAGGDLSSVAVLFPYRGLILAIITILVIVVFLGWRNWKIDKALSIYLLASTAILGATLSVAYRSFPRILSFLFPVGLPLHTRNMKLLAILAGIFLVLDYIAWLAFLTDGFY